HAEAPVRVSRREPAVRRDLIHPLIVEHLEDGVEEVETVVARMALHLALHIREIPRQRLGRLDHAACTVWVVAVGRGTGSPWMRRDSRCSATASSICSRTSSGLSPEAVQPGRSGTYAEYDPSPAFSTTTT